MYALFHVPTLVLSFFVFEKSLYHHAILSDASLFCRRNGWYALSVTFVSSFRRPQAVYSLYHNRLPWMSVISRGLPTWSLWKQARYCPSSLLCPLWPETLWLCFSISCPVASQPQAMILPSYRFLGLGCRFGRNLHRTCKLHWLRLAHLQRLYYFCISI